MNRHNEMSAIFLDIYSAVKRGKICRPSLLIMSSPAHGSMSEIVGTAFSPHSLNLFSSICFHMLCNSKQLTQQSKQNKQQINK